MKDLVFLTAGGRSCCDRCYSFCHYLLTYLRVAMIFLMPFRKPLGLGFFGR
jgi:hypothetical protein